MGLVVAVAVGYLIGSWSSADLATRLASRSRAGGRDALDLRRAGSGNPGATNAAAVLGARWGVFVLVADITKAVVACLAGWAAGGGDAACYAGTAAVAGHCLPVWKRFRGGKGVACSAGQCVATFPAYFPIDLAVAYGTARWKQRAYAATAAASACWVAAALLWWAAELPNLWGPAPSAALPASAALSSVIILAKFEMAARPARRAPAGAPS